MPLREEIKQGFKKFKGKFKAVSKPKDGSDKNSTRPNTPSSVLPHTSSLVAGREDDNPGASVPGTPPPQAPTSPPAIPPPADAADANDHSEQPPQPMKPVEEYHPGMSKPSPDAPGIRSQTTSTHASVSTEQSASRLKASQSTGADIISGDIGSHIYNPVGQLAPQQIHPKSETAGGSSTREGITNVMTGLVGQVVDTFKFGPLKDFCDMLQGFTDMYKLEGTVMEENEQLQQRLQALLRSVEQHSKEISSPVMVSKVNGICEFIEGELNTIRNKQSQEQYGRFLIAKGEEERFLGCCRRIQEYMERLSLDTTLSMWKLEEQHSKDRISSWVRRLPSSPSAWYKSSAGAELRRRECTPGTRIDVLANLLEWTANNSMDAVY